MTAFAQRLAEGDASSNLFLVTGGSDHTGMPAWYYVQVEPKKKLFFQHAIKAGKATLDAFGAIIDSGYGTFPPEHVKQRMKREYGFES